MRGALRQRLSGEKCVVASQKMAIPQRNVKPLGSGQISVIVLKKLANLCCCYATL